MTASFVALWTRPADVAEFERHYREVHLPLAQQWPDVLAWTVMRFTGTPRGTEPAYYLKAEARFADKQTMQRSLSSEQGMASARDAMEMIRRFGVELKMLLGEDF